MKNIFKIKDLTIKNKVTYCLLSLVFFGAIGAHIKLNNDKNKEQIILIWETNATDYLSKTQKEKIKKILQLDDYSFINDYEKELKTVSKKNKTQIIEADRKINDYLDLFISKQLIQEITAYDPVEFNRPHTFEEEKKYIKKYYILDLNTWSYQDFNDEERARLKLKYKGLINPPKDVDLDRLTEYYSQSDTINSFRSKNNVVMYPPIQLKGEVCGFGMNVKKSFISRVPTKKEFNDKQLSKDMYFSMATTLIGSRTGTAGSAVYLLDENFNVLAENNFLDLSFITLLNNHTEPAFIFSCHHLLVSENEKPLLVKATDFEAYEDRQRTYEFNGREYKNKFNLTDLDDNLCALVKDEESQKWKTVKLLTK